MAVICSVFSLSFLYLSYKYMKGFCSSTPNSDFHPGFSIIIISSFVLCRLPWLMWEWKGNMLASIESSKFSSNLSNINVLCLSLSQTEVDVLCLCKCLHCQGYSLSFCAQPQPCLLWIWEFQFAIEIPVFEKCMATAIGQ